ncbi:MAG: 3'-phosphoesterase [Pirellulaceae bacterium]|jgi:hypothetical protein|nr:DNA polymerase ligase N-terminal domain-containing protein [Thermoguttaceae bacterium]MDI9445320.1 DNA polymerase ligase N-terminal domain-containing protein [Planctomycetota bacterium]NLZ01576.1 3'-phosphoesterase [Pirellulaceae bacterium]
MPGFVVLQHDHPQSLHWDFMLEFDNHLFTWSLPLPPCYNHLLPATALPGHRKEYLDYEGPVSKGRGRVARWDRGRFELLIREENLLEVNLCGEKLAGRLRIERATASDDQWRWLLTPR